MHSVFETDWENYIKNYDEGEWILTSYTKIIAGDIVMSKSYVGAGNIIRMVYKIEYIGTLEEAVPTNSGVGLPATISYNNKTLDCIIRENSGYPIEFFVWSLSHTHQSHIE